MTKDSVTYWFSEIWEKEVLKEEKNNILLLLDGPQCHKNITNEQRIFYFPPNTTGKLQPMDISVNKPFKNNIRQQWEEWISSSSEITKSGYNQKPKKEMILKWVENSWNYITKETISNGFTHLFDEIKQRKNDLEIIN
jgi:hypothetical protein